MGNSTDLVTWRHYAGEADLPHILAVRQASKAADGLDDALPLETLRLAFRHPKNSDPQRDVLLAEANGALVAYGRTYFEKEAAAEVYIRQVQGFVRPEWRGRGLGTYLQRWLEARALEAARERGHPPTVEQHFQAAAYDSETACLKLLERHGYGPVRYFFDMLRPNLDDVPDAPLPAGLEVRPARPEHLPAIWQAMVEAFRDHWGAPEFDESAYLRWQQDHKVQPEIWKVAWDTAAGQVAGMVLGFINAEENERYNRRRGYTENISVRRPWRRRGLASALIAENLRELKARGMTEAALGVDSENPTGALGVYQRMGFRPVRRQIVLRKPITP